MRLLISPYPAARRWARRKHHGPPGISSSRSTMVGYNRSRDSCCDPGTAIEDGDEVDSASKPSIVFVTMPLSRFD